MSDEVATKESRLFELLSLRPTVFRCPRNFAPSRWIWVSAELIRGI